MRGMRIEGGDLVAAYLKGMKLSDDALCHNSGNGMCSLKAMEVFVRG